MLFSKGVLEDNFKGMDGVVCVANKVKPSIINPCVLSSQNIILISIQGFVLFRTKWIKKNPHYNIFCISLVNINIVLAFLLRG